MQTQHLHKARFGTSLGFWRVAQPPQKLQPEWRLLFSLMEYNRGYTRAASIATVVALIQTAIIGHSGPSAPSMGGPPSSGLLRRKPLRACRPSAETLHSDHWSG